MPKRFVSNDGKDASIFGSNVCSSSNLLILLTCWWSEETSLPSLGFKTCPGLVSICYNNSQSLCSGVGEVEHEANVENFCSLAL